MQTVLELFKQLPALLQVLIVVSGVIAAGCSTIAVALASLPKTDGVVGWLNRAGHDMSIVTDWLTKLRQRLLAALMIGVVLIVAVACGLKPEAKSPCQGLYCIEVEGLPLPLSGDPVLCYDTQPDMLAAKAAYEQQGKKVTVRK